MDETTKLKCPMPDTHNRLNQAFSLFENILEDYQDILRFTSALNNLIQNLRNVTFVLQKELAHTDGFFDWYSKKQTEMQDDDVLKWLIKARNYVVKEGDLKKKSIARVRLKNHFDQDLLEMELDPSFSTEKIAKDFCKQSTLKIQKNLEEQTIIEIERIWIIDEYPQAEIIDVLIYCLGVITNLVYLCHEEILNTNFLICENNLYIDPLKDLMVTLHNKIRKGRITRINYKTREIYGDISEIINRPDTKTLKEAQKRYGDKQKYLLSLMDKSNKNIPFNNISYHIEMAKHLFNTDGYLVPMAFLYFPDRIPMHITLGLDDPAKKYLIFEKLSETVEETGCEAIIVVTESWMGTMPKKNEEYIPAYIQKKKEFIWIIGATPDKKEEYKMEILRDKNGKIKLNKEEKLSSERNYSLDRIYKNWEIKKKLKKGLL
ncbi:MAG: hypothetical protein PHQ18_04855 [Patescibacteria group bacterium]|nr:hypothetical protein [Patescibacteria group bacterium]